DPLYVAYHDDEWGRPTLPDAPDDIRLFEKLCLEGFQAGLSWLTILRKRPAFREVFHGFDPHRVARMSSRDVTRLLHDSRIVRHRGKIESTINNARRAIEIIEREGSLARRLWSFAPPMDRRPPHRTGETIPPSTPESKALSKALRQAGWTFVGPTTMYAFMQAVGMVNDHLVGCVRHDRVEVERRRFVSRSATA
ncbi:MAG: DNA-3-methyladenine glycosylase I, partial [Phycisphaerales bacterium]|nr:DNA-3-methyladenine glycosylase I [Phycisphaerales bacterium]